MSLAEILERAATALPEDAEMIRPANGDPLRLIELSHPDASRRLLTWLLIHEPEAGAELAASWSEHERGAELLGQLDELALPKAGRKILRRARHRLRASGIQLPEAEAASAAAGVRRLPDIEDSLEAAYVSPLGPRGPRPVYLVERNPGGGARLFEVLVDEVLGIADCEVYSAGRSRVRGFVKEIVQRSNLAAVPAEPASVRALIARLAGGQPKDRPLPRSFGEWRTHIASPARGAATPGERARAILGEGEAEASLERASALVREGVLGPWAPSVERVSEIAEQHRNDDSDDFAALAGELYRGDLSARTAMRFEESAYVSWKLGREEEARACLAAATAFRERSPEENPVAVALCEVLLTPVMAALRARRAPGETAAQTGEA